MAREELLAGGGDLKVPCLRTGEGERGFQWIYESRDVVGNLRGLFVAG